MKNTNKQSYTAPTVRTLSARELLEQLGVAVAGTYGAVINSGYGD